MSRSSIFTRSMIAALALVSFLAVIFVQMARKSSQTREKPAIENPDGSGEDNVDPGRKLDPEAIRHEIKKSEFERRNAIARITDLYPEIAKARQAARTEVKELKDMENRIAEKRRILYKELDELPGMLSMKESRARMLKEEEELLVKRGRLESTIKQEGKTENLAKQLASVEDRLGVILEEKVRLSQDIEKLQETERRTNPEIKSLTSEIIELTHVQAAKANQMDGVRKLVTEQKNLMVRERELLVRIEELKSDLAETGEGQMGDNRIRTAMTKGKQ